MYHGVCRDEDTNPNLHRVSLIRRQIELLRDRLDSITEQNLDGFLAGREPLNRPGFLVTFDDGYANNEETLLWCARAGIYPVVFLSTDWIGTPNTIPIQLVNLISNRYAGDTERLHSEFRFIAEEGGLREEAIASLEKMKKTVSAWYKSLPAVEAEKLLPVMSKHYADLWGNPGAYGMLTWEAVRNLSDAGIRFGSHGQRHHLMVNLSDEYLEKETAESRATIERNVEISCSSFAYPNGKDRDISPQAVEAVARHYKMAFTASWGVIRPGMDRCRLPRVNPDGDSIHVFLADLFLLSLRKG